MSDNKNAKGMTKADVILTRIEQLTKQVSSLETRVARGLAGINSGANVKTNASAGASVNNDAIIRRLTEENATLKKEISFVSAQIEGLFASLSKLINKLPEKMGAVPASGGSNIDVDDLASRVAANPQVPQPLRILTLRGLTTTPSVMPSQSGCTFRRLSPRRSTTISLSTS